MRKRVRKRANTEVKDNKGICNEMKDKKEEGDEGKEEYAIRR